MALRAQRMAVSSVALDVLRSSSVLNAFFRSADTHATIEVSVASMSTPFGQMRVTFPQADHSEHKKWRDTANDDRPGSAYGPRFTSSCTAIAFTS